MARKKKPEEHVNHERWLVSYADFITLLFAFFVVMYSISSVNEGKFRVLSESLVASFRSPNKSLNPIQVGEIARSPHQFSASTQNIPFQTSISPIRLNRLMSMRNQAIDISIDGEGESFAGNAGAMEDIAKNVEEALEPLIIKGLVQLRKNKKWLEIEISTSILFDSGSSKLAHDAVPILKSLSHILKTLANRVNVEGFTDNLPIKNHIYPSNWELSAARAATVVRLFSSYGVDPTRLVSVGYGEFRPVSDNTTVAGRARNRRVTIVVLASPLEGMGRDVDTTLANQADLPTNIASPAGSGFVRLRNARNYTIGGLGQQQ